MARYIFCLVLTLTLTPALSAEWPQFRGPGGLGHAPDARLPTEWSTTKNVTWRQEIPGLGWSSPVAAGGKIYLTTAVAQGTGMRPDYSLRTLCLDAQTGKIEWDKEVFKENGKTTPPPHRKNSHASPTPVFEDGRVYVHFGHLGTACLNAKDGAVVWATQEIKYVPVHGNGGSPVLAAGNLIFTVDGLDVQKVVALEKTTGKLAWETKRNVYVLKGFSFCTPLVIHVNGQEQVIAPGSGVVQALDPKTGREIWRVTYGEGYSVVPRPVYANGLVYLSSGYDSPVLYAIKPDGHGDVTKTHVAWTVKKAAPRNASPLVVDNAVYMVSDDGQLTCLDARTGKERWSERVEKAYSASPLYANGHVYLLSEDGTATVFKPGTNYEEVSKIRMGERALASFAVDGNALLLRTEKALYRIEKQ